MATEPIDLFGGSRTNTRGSADSGGDAGGGVGDDSTADVGEETPAQQDHTSSPLNIEFVPEQSVVIEAPSLGARRGRRSRLNTSIDGTQDKPLQTPSKRAEKYIKKLQMLWYKAHGLVGAIIDDHLRWTETESLLFAEAAYDVFAERGWLKYLDKANEAYLLVIVVEIEISKVKAMLAAQATAPKAVPKGPPPQLRGMTPQANQTPAQGNGVPSFVAAPHMSDLDGLV